MFVLPLLERYSILLLEREPDNPKDFHAVAIQRAGRIVGHVLFNLAPSLSLCMCKDPVVLIMVDWMQLSIMLCNIIMCITHYQKLTDD